MRGVWYLDQYATKMYWYRLLRKTAMNGSFVSSIMSFRNEMFSNSKTETWACCCNRQQNWLCSCISMYVRICPEGIFNTSLRPNQKFSSKMEHANTEMPRQILNSLQFTGEV